jgi:crotonobetainyl-CoA:carnitine CoA-transferase CaiB-like acyl-CoA transferase
MSFFDGLLVAELTTGIAGAYATKLYADAGAEVCKIEPVSGDPLRKWSSTGAAPDGSDGAFFRFLNAGKRSLTGSVEDGDVRRLLASADLVVDNLLPEDPADLAAELHRPGLVRLSITPFGRTGPYRGRPATEFTLQAESGSGLRRGLREHPPYQAGGRITEYVAAAYGAVAAAAALRGARLHGTGQHIDLSCFESITLAANIFADLMHRLAGRPTIDAPPRWVELPSIEPTLDGWVGFNTNSRQQFEDFLVLIGQTGIEGADRLADFRERQLEAERWNRLVRAYTTVHSTDEIVDMAMALRIPVARVNSGRTALDDPHLRERGAFIKSPDGDFEQPRTAYLVNGRTSEPRRPSPRLGQDHGYVPGHAPRVSGHGAPAATPRLPLSGLKIVDCTAWWAGPSSTVVLAALGAEVIHVESANRPDASRLSGGMWAPRDCPWWECSSMFLSANTNKRDLTLDLRTSDGMQAMHRLISSADALVENYSPRVLEQFGLDWERFHDLNPRAVLVRMPAFGLSGPYRDAVGFAQTMEQLTGLAWITGFPDDQPRIQQGPCDPLAGMHAAFALLGALEERDSSGMGCLIEVPMVEAALNAAAEPIAEWSCYGREMEREGNRSPYAAPQGMYGCSGTEQWIAISCEGDNQWEALRSALGQPDWATDPRFETHAGRRLAHDVLDERLSEWCAGQDLEAAVEHLVTHGVPAGRGWDPRLVSDHPQHVARRFHEEVDHPVVGRQPIVQAPFIFTHIGRGLAGRAPPFGEHNTQILAALGYDPAAIEKLEADGVIASRPAGTDRPARLRAIPGATGTG